MVRGASNSFFPGGLRVIGGVKPFRGIPASFVNNLISIAIIATMENVPTKAVKPTRSPLACNAVNAIRPPNSAPRPKMPKADKAHIMLDSRGGAETVASVAEGGARFAPHCLQ